MEAALDYRNVDSIGHSRIMASINQFAERTVDFLNRFSNICDLKLLEVHERINNVEILTTILEKKLSSVNGLGFVPGQPLPPAPAPIPQNNTPAPSNMTPSAPIPPPPPPPVAPTGEAPPPETPAEAAPAPVEEPVYDIKNDPAYKKYFYLVSKGVPPIALRQEMLNNGLDPSVLEVQE